MHSTFIYPVFTRFWHWSQAVLILFLGATGFEIHGSYTFFGYREAVGYHNAAAYAFIGLIAFAAFWHMVTGQYRQYLPTFKNMQAQVEYYLVGIFRNAPHPTRKTSLSRLNPLQRLTYLGLKLLVIPVMVLSGLVYMFYRHPEKNDVISLAIQNLRMPALIHTFGAYMLLAFVIAHIYLTTTGQTITSNLKAMLTGYEDLEEDDHSQEAPENSLESHGDRS